MRFLTGSGSTAKANRIKRRFKNALCAEVPAKRFEAASLHAQPSAHPGQDETVDHPDSIKIVFNRTNFSRISIPCCKPNSQALQTVGNETLAALATAIRGNSLPRMRWIYFAAPESS
jgi:hypothetical protein